MLGRKTYVALASVMKEQLDKASSAKEVEIVRSVANSIADEFQADNPRFDRGRFMNACGLPKSASN